MAAENPNRQNNHQEPNDQADAWQNMADEVENSQVQDAADQQPASGQNTDNQIATENNAAQNVADQPAANDTGEVSPDNHNAQGEAELIEQLHDIIDSGQARIDSLRQTQQALAEQLRELKNSGENSNEKERLEGEIERKEKEIAEAKARLDKVNQQLKKESKDDNHDDDDEESDKFAFAAINVNMQDELRKEAHRLADEAVDAEVAQKGFLTKLWKGNLFNKFYKERYAQQIMRGERTVEAKDGSQAKLSDILKTERGQEHLNRMIGAIVDSSTFMHRGEAMDENRAETARVKDAIRDYYRGLQAGGDQRELEHAFEETVAFKHAEARDNGEKVVDDVTVNNYLEIAKNVIKKVNHEVSLDQVLEGFRVYDAKVTDAVHSSEHNNKIDNLIEKLEGRSGFGMIAAQAAAAAVGIASAFSNAGARALGGVGLGIAASGALAGGRAYHKATVDRAAMMRNAAVNREYSGTSEHPEEFDNRRARKTAKYEAKIGGTIYEMANARDLTSDLNEALNSGDRNAILRATAAIEARIDFSEKEGKDTISYSSAENVGKEDLEMRKALFEAKDYISQQENGVEELRLIQQEIDQTIREDVESKDADFSSERRKVAAKAAVKSVAIGAASFFASQEIGSIFNPRQIGLLEKFNLVQTQNNVDAEQTVLTELFTGPRTYIDNSVVVSGDDTVTRDQLKANGYTETEIKPATPSTREVVKDVPINQAKGSVNVRTLYANNGTTKIDGNELKIMGDGSHGLFNNMNQISTMPDGTPINAPQVASSGALRGLINLDGRQFIVMPRGNAFIDENGFAQLVDIHDNPIGTIQVGSNFNTMSGGFFNDNGDFVSLATQVNHNSFLGTIKQTIIEHFVIPGQYQLDHIVQAGMSTEGVILPTSPVDSLGATRQRPLPPEPTPRNPQVDEPTPPGPQDPTPPGPTPPGPTHGPGTEPGPRPTPPGPTGTPELPPAPGPTGELPPAPEPIGELPPAPEPIGALPPAPDDPVNNRPNNQPEVAGALPPAPDQAPNPALPPAPGDTVNNGPNAQAQPVGELPPASGEPVPVFPPLNSEPVANQARTNAEQSRQDTTEQATSQTAGQTAPTSPDINPDETNPDENREEVSSFLQNVRDRQNYSLDERKLFNRISRYENVLGSRGIIFLTDMYGHPDFAQQYESWYNGLSDEGRAAVPEVLNMIQTSGARGQTAAGRRPTTMGSSFRDWFEHRNVQANNPNGAQN